MSARISAKGREEVLREKRGQGLAARDLVKREGDHFTVTVPSLRSKRPEVYEVRRDEKGRVRCTCPQFESESRTDAKFRCEHIHAVKHAQMKKGFEETATGADDKAGHPPAEEFVGASANTHGVSTESDSSRSNTQGQREREIEAHLNSSLSQERQSETTRSNALATPVTETSEARRSPTPASKSAQVIPLEFASILRALRQPVDPKLVKTREGWTDRNGNRHMVEYVEWHTVADILDRICPMWSHAVKSVVQFGDMVAVTAAITINGVTREGVGTGVAETETGIKKAEHDALKRAAVKFGIARELYQREAEVAEKAGMRAERAITPDKDFGSRAGNNKGIGFGGFPQDPIAKGAGDLVTPKQLGMINRMAREAGVDAEKECRSLMNCKPEDLSKRAASSFIDYLKEYPQSATKTERRAG